MLKKKISNGEVEPDGVNEQKQRWDSTTKAALELTDLPSKSKKENTVICPRSCGIQTDHVNKLDVSNDHIRNLKKLASEPYTAYHYTSDPQASEIDYVSSQKNLDDKSVFGQDILKDFGCKFKVQENQKDKTTLEREHFDGPFEQKNPVFGGQFGATKDYMQESVFCVNETNKPSRLRAMFENLAKSLEEETRRKAEAQKRLREFKDKRDLSEAFKRNLAAALEAKHPLDNDLQIQSVTKRKGGLCYTIAFDEIKLQNMCTVYKESLQIVKKNQVKLENNDAKPKDVITEAMDQVKVLQQSTPPKPCFAIGESNRINLQKVCTFCKEPSQSTRENQVQLEDNTKPKNVAAEAIEQVKAFQQSSAPDPCFAVSECNEIKIQKFSAACKQSLQDTTAKLKSLTSETIDQVNVLQQLPLTNPTSSQEMQATPIQVQPLDFSHHVYYTFPTLEESESLDQHQQSQQSGIYFLSKLVFDVYLEFFNRFHS